MGFVFDVATLAGGLFAGMLILLETGRRLGLRRLVQDSDAARVGFGVVEGANAIGTAYLRLDLLPASAHGTLRESFRHYVEARLEIYRKLPDICLVLMVGLMVSGVVPNVQAALIACLLMGALRCVDLESA